MLRMMRACQLPRVAAGGRPARAGRGWPASCWTASHADEYEECRLEGPFRHLDWTPGLALFETTARLDPRDGAVLRHLDRHLCPAGRSSAARPWASPSTTEAASARRRGGAGHAARPGLPHRLRLRTRPACGWPPRAPPRAPLAALPDGPVGLLIWLPHHAARCATRWPAHKTTRPRPLRRGQSAMAAAGAAPSTALFFTARRAPGRGWSQQCLRVPRTAAWCHATPRRRRAARRDARPRCWPTLPGDGRNRAQPGPCADLQRGRGPHGLQCPAWRPARTPGCPDMMSGAWNSPFSTSTTR